MTTSADDPTPTVVPSTLETMRAVVQDRYGTPDVLTVRSIPLPAPADGQVLIKVHAAGINPADYHLITGKPHLVRLSNGFRRPKATVPGLDLAGVVVGVGPGVDRLSVGDRVFGENGGGYAEYAVAKEGRVIAMPAGMTFEEAAAIPIAALTALQALRDEAGVESGDQVLIVGASGGVGSFAVQIAKAMGAYVTAVASTKNLELVKAIGADEVVDYTTQNVADLPGPFDAIIEMAGDLSPKEHRRLLAPDGTSVWVGSSEMGNWFGPIVHLIRLAMGSMFRSRKLTSVLAKQTPEDLAILVAMYESGDIRPVIDKTYSLEGVPDAIRIQGLKHASGKSVVVP